ncbi:hypothetical protein [Paenibacillus bouchesdurhonensis]|uniref:hypothetical protein n=1 Tax=Paenibacillus bouchesdurhonensis TaxID=1870990 RepID=UPI0018FFDA49|nr:hypothetical protein [Paenibacillus bouchesdurhonensis]
MRPDAAEILRVTFQNLLDRKVTPELMQDFIDRSRRYHTGKDELLAVLDELEKQI